MDYTCETTTLLLDTPSATMDFLSDHRCIAAVLIELVHGVLFSLILLTYL